MRKFFVSLSLAFFSILAATLSASPFCDKTLAELGLKDRPRDLEISAAHELIDEQIERLTEEPNADLRSGQIIAFGSASRRESVALSTSANRLRFLKKRIEGDSRASTQVRSLAIDIQRSTLAYQSRGEMMRDLLNSGTASLAAGGAIGLGLVANSSLNLDPAQQYGGLTILGILSPLALRWVYRFAIGSSLRPFAQKSLGLNLHEVQQRLTPGEWIHVGMNSGKQDSPALSADPDFLSRTTGEFSMLNRFIDSAVSPFSLVSSDDAAKDETLDIILTVLNPHRYEFIAIWTSRFR